MLRGAQVPFGPFPLILTAAVVGIGIGVPLLAAFLNSFSAWDQATSRYVAFESTGAYLELFSAHRLSLIGSVLIRALAAAVVSTVAGLITAYLLTIRGLSKTRLVVLLLLTSTFLTTDIARAFSWQEILGRHGPVNSAVMFVGLSSEPLDWLLYGEFSIIVGVFPATFSLSVFLVSGVLAVVPTNIWRSAQDLRVPAQYTFLRVGLPLASPGLLASILLGFSQVVGASTEAAFLGNGAVSIRAMTSDLEGVNRLPMVHALGFLLALLTGLLSILSAVVATRASMERT